MRTWSIEDARRLTELYPTASVEDLRAAFPGKTPVAVLKKAHVLGLRRSAAAISATRSDMNRKRPYLRRHASPNGYVLLRMPTHPCASKGGLMMEHRVVMEKVLGRFLGPEEVVHHINGRKDDNRPENLRLMDPGSHIALHHTGATFSAERRAKIAAAARARLADKTNHPFYRDIPPATILSALREQPTVTAAAAALGITKRTLYNKMHDFALMDWRATS